jgi:predicted flap endonuclease-1-like 5' DNA nuclease
MDNSPFLFLNVMQDPCLWRSMVASTGAFLLGAGLFWVLFAQTWLRGWKQAKGEMAQLEETLEKLKQQKSVEDRMAFTKHLPGRKALKSDQLPYAGLFTSSNFQFIAGLDEHFLRAMKSKGINEWKDLANIPLQELEVVLETAGLSFDRSKLESWQQQAIWAITDNWQALDAFQRNSIIPSGDVRTPLERAVMNLLGFPDDPQNLCIFAGINPDTQGLLQQAGLRSWQDLAAADTSRLSELLNGGEGYPFLQTWSKQAQLALEGRWLDLNNYQDQLQQSADPDVSH